MPGAHFPMAASVPRWSRGVGTRTGHGRSQTALLMMKKVNFRRMYSRFTGTNSVL